MVPLTAANWYGNYWLSTGGRRIPSDSTDDLASLGVASGATIHAVQKLRGDIGEWGAPSTDSSARILLDASASSAHLLSPTHVAQLVLSSQGPQPPSNIDAAFDERQRLFSPEQCAALIARVDQELTTAEVGAPAPSPLPCPFCLARVSAKPPRLPCAVDRCHS